MQVTGVLVVGETQSAMAYIKARQGISPRQTMLVLLGCMFGIGIPIGAWASGSWLVAALSVEAAAFGLAIGILIVKRLAGLSMRKALVERGQAQELPLTFSITPEAINYKLGDLAITAPWPCVTDLYNTRKYWVFLVQTSVIVGPRRFFATSGAERAFIVAVTQQMTEAARARSLGALKFVGV